MTNFQFFCLLLIIAAIFLAWPMGLLLASLHNYFCKPRNKDGLMTAEDFIKEKGKEWRPSIHRGHGIETGWHYMNDIEDLEQYERKEIITKKEKK